MEQRETRGSLWFDGTENPPDSVGFVYKREDGTTMNVLLADAKFSGHTPEGECLIRGYNVFAQVYQTYHVERVQSWMRRSDGTS